MTDLRVSSTRTELVIEVKIVIIVNHRIVETSAVSRAGKNVVHAVILATSNVFEASDRDTEETFPRKAQPLLLLILQKRAPSKLGAGKVDEKGHDEHSRKLWRQEM